jgi:hypothetical protein|tara:strand:- start:299 stop:730 length:432 start_codon:yes stop_codon:yes gene_type:complete
LAFAPAPLGEPLLQLLKTTRRKKMVTISKQGDLEAGLELAREEMDRQLYQPTNAIEHLDVEEILNDTTQLYKGLDTMKVNEVMLIKKDDQVNFYHWKKKHPRKKMISKSVGAPAVVDQIFFGGDIQTPSTGKPSGYLIVKRTS